MRFIPKNYRDCKHNFPTTECVPYKTNVNIISCSNCGSELSREYLEAI